MLVYMASRYFIKVPVAEEKLGQLLSKRDSHRFSHVNPAFSQYSSPR